MRAKFRNSWEKPEPLIPGKIARVDFTMPDVDHTFAKDTGSWCRSRVHGFPS